MSLFRVLTSPVIATCVVLGPSNPVDAAFDWYNQDFAGWQAASGSYATIDFSGFANLTVITDQYSGSGVLFTGPQPNLTEYVPGGGYLDDWGLNPQSYLEVTFLWPMHSVGVHIPGNARIQLFLGDEFLYQTAFVTGDGTKFTGVTSGIEFDRVRFLSAVTGGSLFTDNLYFSTVPGPAPISRCSEPLYSHEGGQRGVEGAYGVLGQAVGSDFGDNGFLPSRSFPVAAV